MRILNATGIFPPDIGGPATYTAKFSSALVKRGIETAVISYSDVGEYENYDFRVIRVSRKRNVFIRYFIYFLKSAILARNVDLIYAQDTISAGLPAFLSAKLLRKKFVMKIVGDSAWERARENGVTEDDIITFQEGRYNFKTEFLRKIQRFVSQRADKIIVPSFYLKNIVKGWGIGEDKIFVIYNAAELKAEPGPASQAKQKLGLDGDIILSVGRLVPWKGFDGLIGIMPELLKHNTNIKLIIIGEGPEEESLKSKVKNLKLDDVVSFIGRVEHSKMSLYFAASDIFVLNSSYEGLSHVIIEAMAAHVPVVASNVGGNPELINDGINGFLVDPHNKSALQEKILELLQNKEMQNKFIHNSSEKLKQFSFDKMIEDTIKVLAV